LQDRLRAIRIVCEGLSGTISVNGLSYTNTMPAQVLDDAQVADVLTYVTNSWGARLDAFRADEVRETRKSTQFPIYEELVKATAYAPLPKPPEGWTVREVARLPEFCTRLAGNGKGRVYVLAQSGRVYYVDQQAGAVVPIIKAEDYAEQKQGGLMALGMVQDEAGRLWIVTDRCVRMEGEKHFQNEVIIYRTSETVDGHPAKPRPWFKTHYPFGVGPYNHGVSTIGFGPDGMLYVNSGSRTDGGEPGTDPQYYSGGEVELTASIWRLDPKAETPKVEVIAHGIRNAFGFGWDKDGNFFTASNGPTTSAPEELDCVVPGKHYGFPYQFSDWPVKPHFPYPHTPAPPPGLEFTPPLENIGPAAGGSVEHPLATFDAHSSPGGMIWCGEDFPAPLGGGFLITRFGNLFGPPAVADDVGFDVLSCKVERKGDGWICHTSIVLAPLGRPLDALRSGPGRALILEYTRPTNLRDKLGWLPGRIIELAPARSGQGHL
jgi:glucose/arabinose dehydrogenase